MIGMLNVEVGRLPHIAVLNNSSSHCGAMLFDSVKTSRRFFSKTVHLPPSAPASVPATTRAMCIRWVMGFKLLSAAFAFNNEHNNRATYPFTFFQKASQTFFFRSSRSPTKSAELPLTTTCTSSLSSGERISSRVNFIKSPGFCLFII